MLTIFLRHQPNVRTSINAACLLEKMAYISVSQGQKKRWWGIKKNKKERKRAQKIYSGTTRIQQLFIKRQTHVVTACAYVSETASMYATACTLFELCKSSARARVCVCVRECVCAAMGCYSISNTASAFRRNHRRRHQGKFT